MQCISVWSQRNLMCLFLANFLPPEPAEPEGNCPPRFFCRIRKKKCFIKIFCMIQEGQRIGSGAERWKGREKLLPLPKILAELEAKNIPSFMYQNTLIQLVLAFLKTTFFLSLMPCPFTGPKMFCASPIFLSQPKNLTAFNASSKTFVPAQKPILLNANHLFVWHKMFVTATICK